MTCPNCGQKMEYQTYNHQNILHCFYCGGSFFEENAINRITLATAKALAIDKQASIISEKTKHCPKDDSPLSPIEDDQAIPSYITLLRCPNCQGIFAYPDDLVQFKKAQEAKISFFKTWHKPIPAIKSVLILGSLALVFISILSTIFTFQQKPQTQTQAQEVIKNPVVVKSSQTLLIHFQTSQPLRSEIVFTNKKTGQTTTLIVSNQPTRKHQLVTNEINLNTPTQYKIILYDNQGKVIEGPKKRL